MVDPVFMWAGGKRKLLPELLKRVPSAYNRYYEPFLGGAALFFRLQPREATLSDANVRLIRAYWGIRNHVEEVIDKLTALTVDKETFNRFRAFPIDAASHADTAVWLLYLNHTCFNGLYRVNSKGEFNTPWGKKNKETKLFDSNRLVAASTALKNAQLFADRYHVDVMYPGDLVYFDPPYIPLNATSFISYTTEKFGPTDHAKLRDFALSLKRRGVHVILSNSDTPLTHVLYHEPDFHIETVEVARTINCKGTGRGKVKEVIIT